MPRKKYVVTLAADEREHLVQLTSFGKASAHCLTRARILLKADAPPGGPGWIDARIADALEVCVNTVKNVRRWYIERGLKAALARKPQALPSHVPKLDGRRLQELAHQSPRIFGKKTGTWTLQLLADTCSEI